MLHICRRLYSKLPLIDDVMAQRRYFPNNLPDYQPAESQPQPSEQHLAKHLEKVVNKIANYLKPLPKHGSDGLYLGTAGISYMYYQLTKNAQLSDEKRALYLSKAQEYLSPAIHALKSGKTNDIPSFILGHSGVYAVASVIYNKAGNKGKSDEYAKRFHQAAKICQKKDFLRCGSDELFVGRAGYVLGCLWLSRELKVDPPLELLHSICKIMIESGKEYSNRHRSRCPLMYSYYNVEYLGAAHGLCSILQAIISVPNYLTANTEDDQIVCASVDYLLCLQDSQGNFPCSTDEIGHDSQLVHWCHGAGGMIYLMAKAYLHWKDARYLASCERMGDLIWQKGLLRKGPGICHGVAGNAYAFLLLHRLTNQEIHLHRARMFALFMESEEFARGARTPDYPYSLYEGLAGTACFLSDLMQPDQAEFPFSDVF